MYGTCKTVAFKCMSHKLKWWTCANEKCFYAVCCLFAWKMYIERNKNNTFNQLCDRRVLCPVFEFGMAANLGASYNSRLMNLCGKHTCISNQKLAKLHSAIGLRWRGFTYARGSVVQSLDWCLTDVLRQFSICISYSTYSNTCGLGQS